MPVSPHELTLLRRWLAGDPPALGDCQNLANGIDPQYWRAFGIPLEQASNHVQELAAELQRVFPQLAEWDLGIGKGDCSLGLLWQLWLPLAAMLARRHQEQARPLVWGILGLQGTGKTTLARILQTLLAERGYAVLSLSIDDLYKTYRDRQRLQAEDPHLVWRGPPGTHDVDLGIELLDRLKARQTSVAVPRFDKSLFAGAGDRVAPQICDRPVDIVLFEGWFVGVRPIAEQVFEAPPWPIQTASDRDFARVCNVRLATYLPLWARLDGLLALYPEDYRYSQRWRQEAERQARGAGKPGMGDREVAEFVEYFWRALHPELFVKPLLADPEAVDLAITLDFARSPQYIYAP